MKMSYCQTCGNKLEKEDSFCQNCGSRSEEFYNKETTIKDFQMKGSNSNQTKEHDIHLKFWAFWVAVLICLEILLIYLLTLPFATA